MITPEQLHRYSELLLTVEAELGRTIMPMREIAELAEGSVIRLPVRTGSRVNLLTGGAPFASGEFIKTGRVPAVRLVGFAASAGSGKSGS